jgi:tetratricopeptide (TPR) repeat protein
MWVCHESKRTPRCCGQRKNTASSAPIDIAELVSEATLAYQEGRFPEVEVICKRVQARAPAHTANLNVLGLTYQATRRHRLAVKTFTAAIALDDLDAACHYNIACSYQALEQREAAATHFKKAIALGLSGRDVEQFLMKNAAVVECIARMTDNERARRI